MRCCIYKVKRTTGTAMSFHFSKLTHDFVLPSFFPFSYSTSFLVRPRSILAVVSSICCHHCDVGILMAITIQSQRAIRVGVAWPPHSRTSGRMAVLVMVIAGGGGGGDGVRWRLTGVVDDNWRTCGNHVSILDTHLTTLEPH